MIERNEQSDIRVLDAQSEAWFVERDDLGRLSSLCSAVGCWSFRYSPLGLLSAYSEPTDFGHPYCGRHLHLILLCKKHPC